MRYRLVDYTYDALGRLIRKQTPVRDGTTLEQLALRTERYYYDGARRIQEVATEPIIDIDPEPQGPGGPGGPGGGGGGLTLAEEMELLEREGTPNIFVDREYVYVPSGASGYVDEFICQIDRYQDLWYILQDVNSNVIALTDSGGEVVRQHTFDPYGEILTAEDFDTHHGIKVGHQGLFFDRLELPAAVSGSVSLGSATQLQPGVFGLYQVRNRVLLSRYGRWAQKDPNASGMLHAALWNSGESPAPEMASGSLASVLSDGLNLFTFVGDSPSNRTDPAGLFFLFTTQAATIRSINDSKHNAAVFGTVQHVRAEVLKHMGSLASYGNAAVEALLVEFSGTGIGLVGTAGVAAYRSAEAMAAKGTLLPFSRETFRHNHSLITGFAGRAIGTVLHAHHMIPHACKKVFAKLKIDVNNPVFARWMWPDAHTALHASKAYNKEWMDFGKQ